MNQSRRNFIKGAGVAAISAAALGFTGCAQPKSASERNSEKSSGTVNFDDTYDVVIVGAGIAGLAAAATVATEGNGQTALLIEKGSAGADGNSPYSSGFCMYTEDPDGLYTYVNNLQGDTECTPDDVLRAYCEGAAENLTWIENLGAPTDQMMIGKPGAIPFEKRTNQSPEYPELAGNEYMAAFKFNGGQDKSGYKHIHTWLLDFVQSQDAVTYKTDTAMESLVMDGDRVIGVSCGKKAFKANKGVILCCGGYESNAEMLYNFNGMKGVVPQAAKSNTGDGHKACAQIGASFWHMHSGAQFWLGARNLDNTEFLHGQQTTSTKEYGITVAVNGRRFYMDWDGCGVGDVMPDGSDLTANVGYRHGATQWGGRWTHLPMPEKAWFVFDADGLEKGAIPKDKTTDPVKDGWAYAADTVEELAGKIGVPASELANTVKIWNGFCDEGEDKAFYRPAAHMNKVAKAPFYAMLCVPAMLNTDGGPRRSAKGEVLDVSGNPIPGLYSAGEFGSIWGAMYQGTGNIGECCIFGRIAVRNALGNV
jgi:succinate dehydrogenase/fumarate reductase flavoprotein subunit